jgi:hypothetical protein
MPKIKKRTARSTLDVNVVVGASSSAVAQAGGKKAKLPVRENRQSHGL